MTKRFSKGFATAALTPLLLTIAPASVLADSTGITTATATFTQAASPTQPQNPETPGTDTPIDVGGGEVTGDGSGLTLVYVPQNLDFKTTSLWNTSAPNPLTPGMAMDLYANPLKDNLDVAHQNFAEVYDGRGTFSGWSLTVAQSGEFKNASAPAAAQTLNGASITFTKNNVITQQGPATGVTATPTTALNGQTGAAQVLLNATEGNGTGDYQSGFADLNQGTINLNIPANAQVATGTYSTTLTWTLSNLPA